LVGLSIHAHVEFDCARQFDDGFWMMAVFEQRVFDRMRAIDEKPAVKGRSVPGRPTGLCGFCR